MTIAANTKVQVKFGKNIIEGEVLAELTENIYQVKNLRTGNIMNVPAGRIQQTLEADDTQGRDGCTQDSGRALLESPTCCARESHEVQIESPASLNENLPRPSSEPPAKRGRKPRNGKSLMDIALEVMQTLQTAMSVPEILEAAKNEGLFNPEDWGKTPAQTLYSSFMRENKLPNGRVRKSVNRGHWELA